jgi:UDP-N-acetylglucosamine acyltransferase
MVTRIHPTALVDPRAELGQNVEVGPFCLVEAGAVIGDDCQLGAHVAVRSRTTLGRQNEVGEGAVLGAIAQHAQVHEPGGTLMIGDRNRIRENVTVHRGWANDAATIIGDDNLLMVSSHVGHDCHVSNRCILVNHVLLGGFVQVNDGAYLGGAAAVVQHCRIGRLAMIGAMTKISQDVPPFVLVADAQVVGLNRVGLARKGFTAEEMLQLKAAYQIIYRQGRKWDDVLATLKAKFTSGPAADFNEFLSVGKRGFVQERRLPRKTALKMAESGAAAATDAPEQPAQPRGRWPRIAA